MKKLCIHQSTHLVQQQHVGSPNRGEHRLFPLSTFIVDEMIDDGNLEVIMGGADVSNLAFVRGSALCSSYRRPRTYLTHS